MAKGGGASASGLFRHMGPAWIVSAVACGPATLASVSLAGSTYGYRLLWVVVLSAGLAFVAQSMAARLGVLTGRGVVSVVDERLGRVWGWVLMIDALACTWLASTVLMKALVETSSLITGLKTPLWSPLWAGLIFALVGLGGYRVLERVCKLLVAGVVVCFMIALVIVRPEWGQVFSGLIPSLPGGMNSALLMAGIMGGAVHVTIIAMHTYNVGARGWGRPQLGLALNDTFWSMFVAFGLYSAAIFITTAAVLHPAGIKATSALGLAAALEPFLGPYASAVLLAGILGAVVSTISPTFLAAGYFVADKMGWPLSVKDRRFLLVVGIGCLISLLAPLLPGSFLLLLVIMLALGLCGTPLILVLLLLLLNRADVVGQDRNSWLLNLMGVLTLAVTTFLALRFILARLGLWG